MTKIDIFSGFLGAGKTTLIKKLIAEAYTGEQLVLIENEFGEIGIDGGFLQEAGINITEMNSGCICCSLVGDFGKALQQVMDTYHPDRILIEPSGVGKLSDVIRAVQNLEMHDVVLNGFTTVVDATKAKIYMKNFGEFYNNQIESAGTIILSRTQKLSQEKLEAAVALLREKNPTATIVTTPWDELDGKQLLAAMERRDTLAAALEELAEEQEHEHHHHDDDECGCGCHDHDHDHDGHDHNDHDHDALEDGHGEDIEYDEHIWTSPVKAMALCRAICETLCEADPAHGENYRGRLETYLAELETLDGTFREIAEQGRRRLLVFGDRFPLLYFVKEYGNLQQARR